MDKLPNYLIENYIIPYISSHDLFFSFRSLNSYYYICARNKILTHFPSEMMFLLKKIIEFNTKEDLTKNFEEIMKKTFEEKRMLLIIMIQANLSLAIKNILETNRDQRNLELISFFYVITQNQNMYNLLQQNKLNDIQRISGEEEGIIDTREKITNVLEEDNLNYDINEYNTVYDSLDREFLTQNNDTHALYNYTGLLIRFCSTKIRLNEVKSKLQLFFEKISEASEIWPKKRIFYEKSIDLVANTQILSEGAKLMINLMKKYDIENELSDYLYERNEIKDYKNIETFELIKNNRKRLNSAILRIEQMYYFFDKCSYPKFCDIKNTRFKIGNWIMNHGEFLYILSMINKNLPINEYTFIITRNNLRKKIICSIYNIHNEKEINSKDEEKNDEISINDTYCKCLLPNNMEHLNEGLNELKKVIENTKLAGDEIDESFKKFSNGLNNINESLQ